MYNLLNLTQPQPFTARRESSWDKSGGNADAWYIKPDETKVLAELEGPGIISHIWFTISSEDKYYLRKILLRVYWDDEETPSIETPVGDFFGLGHSRSYTYNSAPFTCSNNNPGEIGDGVAMNCWLPMPFNKKARIEIVNQQDVPIPSFYFYIDWQKHEKLPDDTLYLHAKWRRDQGGADKVITISEACENNNLSDKDNYLLLHAQGSGHFIGVNMSVDNVTGEWWGEGDDMIFIDRDDMTIKSGGVWPPDLHGTGSEDYLCQAWGMQKCHSLFYGEPWYEFDEATRHHTEGKVCVYRYHVLDPIPFTKNIRVSIENGHANSQKHDYSSVAYWYQNEPHIEFTVMPPPDERLPK